MTGPAAELLSALRFERDKLSAQPLCRVTAAGCVLGPFALVVLLRLQTGLPKDTLFGRHVRESGYASPLLVLGFAGQWLLPLLAALVAGDIFSGEDRHGTWKTVLTRSCGRGAIFRAKTLTAAGWTVTVVVLLAGSSLAAGVLLIGSRPLVGLSGQLIAPGHATLLVAASWASVLPPALGFAALAILLSVASRSSVTGVAGPVIIGLVMLLLSLVPGIDLVRHLLLATPFGSWHGLLSEHPAWWPLVRGFLVSAVYVVGCVAAAGAILRGRDISDG